MKPTKQDLFRIWCAEQLGWTYIFISCENHLAGTPPDDTGKYRAIFKGICTKVSCLIPELTLDFLADVEIAVCKNHGLSLLEFKNNANSYVQRYYDSLSCENEIAFVIKPTRKKCWTEALKKVRQWLKEQEKGNKMSDE